MRIDRALTLGLIGPLQRLTGVAPSGIPILMYHAIAPDLDAEQGPYFRTVTSPARFAGQIESMQAAGYVGVTLSDAVALLALGRNHTEAGRPAVVITFDDGFRDFRESAFPVLQRAAYTASVFMPTHFIGKRFITGRVCLDAVELRELSAQGVEFGSHSASHRRLVDLDPQELSGELAGSKAALEDVLGHEVRTFSYPFRFPEQNAGFVRLLSDTLDRCGYRCGVTTAIGRSTPKDDPRFLPRLPMNDCDDTPLLRAKLAGHYDWLRSGQRIRKHLRAAWQRGSTATGRAAR